MARVELRYIRRFADRNGHVRHYFRRPGFPRATLPGAPGSPGFMSAYQATLAAAKPPIGAAALRPAAWPRWWQRMSARRSTGSSRQSRARPTEHLPKIAARAWRQAGRAAPARARQAAHGSEGGGAGVGECLLKMLRILIAFAVDDGWRRDNPTIGVKRQRSTGEGWCTWSTEDVARFNASWAPGTRARLALKLLLCTGQRRSDIVRMGRQHVKGGVMAIRQSKTKTA